MEEDLYSSFCKWAKDIEPKDDGLIVACDISQEWLLPWWWGHYILHNSYPVTFVDLGMSHEKKEWCKQRGNFVRLAAPDIFVKEKEEIKDPLILEWENSYGRKFWPRRQAWFKKPMAFLKSPYLRTVWCDLDCEIRAPLSELFSFCENSAGISLAHEKHDPLSKKTGFNSGVVVYKYGLALIEEWAKLAVSSNDLFPGDQDVLSLLILEQNLPVVELPHIYNWSRLNEENADAKIFHWHGDHGKAVIEFEIMRANQPF